MSSAWARFGRWVPGPGDLIFGIVLGLILVGCRFGLLNDPGTPWHLRLGRDILASGSVPRHDLLTYTRQGASWVDQSWGFDVLLAATVPGASPPATIVALRDVGDDERQTSEALARLYTLGATPDFDAWDRHWLLVPLRDA